MILAGTAAGVYLVEPGRTLEVGGAVRALARAGDRILAATEHEVLDSRDGLEWRQVGKVEGFKIRCLVAAGEEVLAGTSEAHLYRVASGGRVESFEDVKGRESWFTPWGGPPDTRSASVAPDGALHVNVHVGGIPRSLDGGESWEPTIDVEADVHQVLAHEGLVFAACARGLATSEDGSGSWRTEDAGLHAGYCRAVAVAGDTLLVSASTGPFSKQGAVYRRPVGSTEPFQRCAGGLPGWFASNVDSHCLAARGDTAAIADDAGNIWVSADRGGTWELAASGLPRITCLEIAPIQSA